jgi:hypothetical protein
MQVAVCLKNSEAFSVNLVKFGGFIYNKIEEKIFTMSGKVKRTETSELWKYFTKKMDDINKAACRYCKAVISRGGKNAASKGFTTTNMWAHVKRFHPEFLEKVTLGEECLTDMEGPSPAKKQATITEIFSRSASYSSDHPRAREITKLIVEEMCLDMEPLDHVNKKGFQRLMKNICPKYEMVSRTHITQTILPDMYNRVKTKIQCELKNLPYISVTTDLWTSDSSSHVNDFISITAHGLNKNFELKNFCLEVMPFEGEKHSAENISDNLQLAMLEWEITDRVKVIVTDNARNIVNAVKDIHEVKHVPCMAHTLQLVLQDGLLEQTNIKDVVNTARKIVGHFSHSTTAMKLLQEAQETYNIPQHVLIQNVPTRWNSTYLMLNRLYEQRIAIQAVLPKLNCQFDLNTQQWILVEQVVQILVYFEDVTKALSKDAITLSDAIPLINSLFRIIQKISSDDTKHQTVRNMVETLQTQMIYRYGNIEENETYILATALDPRYKTRIFRNNNASKKVTELLYSAITEEKTEISPSVSSPNRPSTSTGIWSICREIIDDSEISEPLSNFASKIT